MLPGVEFTKAQLSTRLAGDDLGDAFQRFVCDLLLAQYPGLHLFPTRGRDGGIDLACGSDGRWTVFECKYIGMSTLSSARSRWKEVEKNLRGNLTLGSEPPPGEGQYRPWLRADTPITKYVFCVSSSIKNLDGYQNLRDEIAEFFGELPQRYAHLQHLAGLAVDVLDWSDLCVLLQRQPHTCLRWFRAQRPAGLVPLDLVEDEFGFHAYLASGKLPYYSRSKHLSICPQPLGVTIPDERALLAQLAAPDITGMVITGGGGLGKTRLALEIAHLALDHGWTVVRARQGITADAVKQLADTITPETQALIHFDYVEALSDFGGLEEELRTHNDTRELRIRYIGTCRPSYYRSLPATSGRRHFDLSPVSSVAEESWHRDYQDAIVRHVLEEAGLPVTESYLRVCRGTPVLAVFLSYLSTTGRRAELSELLQEESFGTWVARRVQRSFAQDIRRELAQMMALLPMPCQLPLALNGGTFRSVLDTLANDQWVERRLGDLPGVGEQWASLHDVLADQIVLAHLRSFARTADLYADDLLRLAEDSGCLRSALLSLQRVADEEPVRSLYWHDIIAGRVKARGAAWANVSSLLIQTPLLSIEARFAILRDHEGVFAGQEARRDFQNALGLLTRSVARGSVAVSANERATLEHWLEKVCMLLPANNFPLRFGLEFAPKVLKEPALAWLQKYGRQANSQYVLTPWLRSGLPPEEVAEWVGWLAAVATPTRTLSHVLAAWLRAGGEPELVAAVVPVWLEHHGSAFDATYVLAGWLDAGGEPGLVAQWVAPWLEQHGGAFEARYVLAAWLRAGGERELVAQWVAPWLEQHGGAFEATYVLTAWLDAGGDSRVQPYVLRWLDLYGGNQEIDSVLRAWLEAGGDFELVRDASIAWLHSNFTRLEAVYLTKFLVKQPELPLTTVAEILQWCQRFPGNEDALWRLTGLRKHLYRRGVADDVLAAAQAVVGERLRSSAPLPEIARGQITACLCTCVTNDWMQDRERSARVNGLLREWIKSRQSFGSRTRAFRSSQRPEFLERVASLLDEGYLAGSEEEDAVKRVLAWVFTWNEQPLMEVQPLIEDLRALQRSASHGKEADQHQAT